MSVYSEILGINQEDLSTLSIAYSGYGLALEKSNEKQENAVIASSYLISAIYKSIIKPGNGSLDFIKAAEHYKSEGNAFWVIPAICSGKQQFVKLESKIDDNGFLQNDIYQNFLSQLRTNENLNFRKFEEFRDIPVGSLKIPLRFYIDAISDLRRNETYSFEQVLLRSSEHITYYQKDDYHWSNLNGSFLPIEPETLAFCICAVKVRRNKILPKSKLSEEIQINSLYKIPLLIAEQIISDDNSEDFRIGVMPPVPLVPV
jgi:hypothetical protein